MMINHHNELGYDPSDRKSYPYGFNSTDMVLDQSTIDRAADLDSMELLRDLLNPFSFSKTEQFRVLDLTLKLFLTLMKDDEAHHPFDGLTLPDIFAVAIDTALIWERG